MSPYTVAILKHIKIIVGGRRVWEVPRTSSQSERAVSNWNFNFALRRTKAMHSIAVALYGDCSANLHWQLERG